MWVLSLKMKHGAHISPLPIISRHTSKCVRIFTFFFCQKHITFKKIVFTDFNVTSSRSRKYNMCGCYYRNLSKECSDLMLYRRTILKVYAPTEQDGRRRLNNWYNNIIIIDYIIKRSRDGLEERHSRRETGGNKTSLFRPERRRWWLLHERSTTSGERRNNGATTTFVNKSIVIYIIKIRVQRATVQVVYYDINDILEYGRYLYEQNMFACNVI